MGPEGPEGPEETEGTEVPEGPEETEGTTSIEILRFGVCGLVHYQSLSENF